MIVYKCKMCNGNLDMSDPKRLMKCNYCDTYQSVPSVIDEDKAEMVNRANRYRQNGEFDRAASIYEQILREDATDPEIHWSLVLCKFGVEYVEDPATKRMMPTVNRTQSHSILHDPDYQNAIAIAETDTKQYYMTEADKIDKIQRSIWRIAQDSEDYDVFISYKEKGPDGQRTKSSLLAQQLYEQLTAAKIKTFYSRISLAEKLGNEFEPYIFSAINSAKVMLVLGTNKEELNAPWVKNEWSRFRKLSMTDSLRRLIPCVQDMTIEDLPDELQPYQAQDMNNEGYEQYILEAVKKIISNLKTVDNNFIEDDPEKLWKKGEAYLLLKDFERAEVIYKELCSKEPEDYRSWWGRIRAVTKDLSDIDASKEYHQDLNAWLNYTKKLATEEIYLELLKKYVEYLKKVSKQSVYEEMENVKKVKEETLEQANKFKDELIKKVAEKSSEETRLEIQCDDLENSLMYPTYGRHIFTTESIISGAPKKILEGLTCICLVIAYVGFELEQVWFFVPGLLGFLLLILCRLSDNATIDAFESETETYSYNSDDMGEKEERLTKTRRKLESLRNNRLHRKDYLQRSIQKCDDIVENADRYLTYSSDDISNLLFAILCSEIGEDTPIDHELFQVRQHTFQTIL